MKLELKHLAPYLPYGVSVSEIHNLHYGEGIGSIVHLLTTKSERYKMRLRPLSDLTKEIEHNGERFVPLKKLFKIKYKGQSILESEIIGDLITDETYGYAHAYFDCLATKRLTLCKISQEDTPYWITQKLFEWHFDVFGLIDKGLAIDKNLLK